MIDLSMLKNPRQLAILGLCLLAAGYVVWLVAGRSGGSAPDAAYYRMYVCVQTDKPFRHRVQVGDTCPILSPFSGKETGYPAEACYWTADGTLKKDPDWVVLNDLQGKHGPTFCPVCGRLVVGHNPDPPPGSRPPPTREQYYAAHGGNAAANAGMMGLFAANP